MKSPSVSLAMSGFGNEFATEAVPGALPRGRNSPQRPPFDLYPEMISGTAFTAPRAENRRSWMYRRQPSVVVGRHVPYEQPYWRSGAAAGVSVPPDALRWRPFEWPGEAGGTDFVDGVRTIALNGDVETQTGLAAHVYRADRSMRGRAFVDADGELLFVPQHGAVELVTEMGRLHVMPGEIALVPRGVAFRVDLPDLAKGAARGYLCENHGAHFRLPELGPIGSNGLANARDFVAPVAAFEEADGPCELIRKSGGRLWAARLARTPFDVVAWHGNLAPCKYDTKNFMTIGSISHDHPDPSIFTVLTSPSGLPGVANCDFVIFPPRWQVAEDTFRPPWFHRNVASEFMGLVYGAYDAKSGGGFLPGGVSLHNSMVPHGPDADAFEKASAASLAPQKLDHTLAFMFESRFRLLPTEFAMRSDSLDDLYAECWSGLADRFRPAAVENR